MEDFARAGMRRVRRAVCVVDMVESVRLMQVAEADTIERWRGFVRWVRDELLPVHSGRMVKSLGDGMLLEFAQVPAALSCAFAMWPQLAHLNAGRDAQTRIHLRVGVHVAEVVADEFDIYGAGVNVAARLAALGAPGDVVVSSQARDELLPVIDAELEDLGECFLKHMPQPQRAFKAWPPGARATWPRAAAADTLTPGVAVLPFEGELDAAEGAALADDLLAAIGRSTVLRPVARRSVAMLAGRALPPLLFARAARAHFAVSARLQRGAGHMRVQWQLHEVRSGELVREGHWQGPMLSLLHPSDNMASAVAMQLLEALVQGQLRIAHHTALSNLPAYALLLRAVALMHRLENDDLERSRQALEAVVDRNPRSPEALSWLGKWHFDQVSQARSADPMKAIQAARGELARALAEDERHALALAIDGHLDAFVDRNLPGAEHKLRTAYAADANEPLASLFLANVLAYSGRGAEAVAAIERAEILSPLDPMRSMYDLFASTAHSAAGLHEEALHYARRSVAHCAVHLSALVQLIVAEVQAGLMDEARQTAARYLVLRPAASVQLFRDRHIAAGSAVARTQADALLAAGIPL